MPDHPCQADGCPRPGRGRYCSTHAYRLRKHGSLDEPQRYQPAPQRFDAQHDHGPGCWLWTGSHDRDGYGVLRVDGRQVRAHRYSWELHVGPIPADAVVMHTCDRPPCVNPKHLRLGTHRNNADDSVRKNRRPHGSRNPASKLTEGEVLNLRAEYAAGSVSQAALAQRYSVSRALVSNIVTRKIWRRI